jgi:hypothetical protein
MAGISVAAAIAAAEASKNHIGSAVANVARRRRKWPSSRWAGVVFIVGSVA